MGFNKLASCGQGQKLFRKSPPMTISCLISIYLTCTPFSLGKIQIQLMLNTKQHEAQMYAEMLLPILALLSFAFSSCIR